MTNPNNAVGTNGAYGGRTSVDALNDVLSTFKGRGLLSGFELTAGTGLKINVGGGDVRDVAIAEDNAGNLTTVNNRSGAPIQITMPTPLNNGYRTDTVVIYVNNPPQVSATTTDNPSACGIIVVEGSWSQNPFDNTATEEEIRSAITADGGLGTSAYYVVLGLVAVPANATQITNDAFMQGNTTRIISDVMPIASMTQFGCLKFAIGTEDIGEGGALDLGVLYGVIQ